MYKFHSNQHVYHQHASTMKIAASSAKVSPRNNVISKPITSQPACNHRLKNFKPLHERSGVMKCRALDLLGKQTSESTDTSNDVGLQRLGEPAYRRGLSHDERKRISRSRASELSAMYELSESKNTDLNRKAIIQEPLNLLAPSLDSHMQMIKQAVTLVSQEQETNSHRQRKEGGTKEEPRIGNRKGSFDAQRKIRNKMIFPRRSVSASHLDGKKPIRNAESRDDEENRIPNVIHCDEESSRKSLLEKHEAVGCTNLASDLCIQHHMVELPELC